MKMATRTLDDWFDAYARDHKNPTNKQIHYVCVPLIYLSVVGFLAFFNQWVGLTVITLVTAFYGSLNLRLAIVMGLLTLLSFALLRLLPHVEIWAAVVFVGAWIGQFYGHHLEGQKPSFFEDLQFLLIGPIWVVDAGLRFLKIEYR